MMTAGNPSGMNDLLQTYTLLGAGLRDDPLLCLANTVVWLDPLWQEADDEWDMPQDEDGTLAIALRVTRTAFPDIYMHELAPQKWSKRMSVILNEREQKTWQHRNESTI